MPDLTALLVPGVRRLLAIAVGSVLIGNAAGPAMAQAWPSRTVTVVVPFGPGNSLEPIGRPLLDHLSKRLGQPFIVENRPGAGGTTGAAHVARAAPDGHTLLLYSSSFSISHSVHPKRPYDTIKDFIPVIPLGVQPSLLITAANNRFADLGALIAEAKARPGALNYASAGPGSASHVAAERFRLSAGIDAKHVPFRSPSDALTETLTGRIDFYFPPIGASLPLIRDGKLMPLATSTKTRASALPDVPTTTELGLKDSAFDFWFGLFVAANTSREIVTRLHSEVAIVLDLPDMKERMRTFSVEPLPLTVEQFGTYFREDIEDLAKLIKAAGITAN